MVYTPRRITGKTMKLCRLYKGPYLVVRRMSECNYVVRMGRRLARSDVIHINRMKPFHARQALTNT